MALAETTGLSVMQLLMLQQASLGMCTGGDRILRARDAERASSRKMWLPTPGEDSHCMEDSKDHNNIKCQKSEPTDVVRCVL